MPSELVKRKIGGQALRYFIHAGGLAGIGLNANDMREDYQYYSGKY